MIHVEENKIAQHPLNCLDNDFSIYSLTCSEIQILVDLSCLVTHTKLMYHCCLRVGL